MEPLDLTALNPVVTYKLTSKSRFHLIHFPTMSDFNNTLNTGNGRELERKDRATSDSDSGNVVDHYAPHGGSPFPAEQDGERPSKSWILTRVTIQSQQSSRAPRL